MHSDFNIDALFTWTYGVVGTDLNVSVDASFTRALMSIPHSLGLTGWSRTDLNVSVDASFTRPLMSIPYSHGI